MADEIPPTQVPATPPVPPPDQARPNVQAAAPPATSLVVHGEVKSERELAIERREAEIARRESITKDVELNLSDKERKIQEREEALRNAPPVPTPAPEKVKRTFFIRTLINTDTDNE